MKSQVGIIGTGTIGTFLIKKLGNAVKWVYDIDVNKATRIKATLNRNFKVLSSLQELDKNEDINVDLVVECASQSAVNSLVNVLKHNDVIVASVGAFADQSIYQNICSAAKKHNHKVMIPSGAIAGLDAIKSMKNIRSVVLETIKNPRSIGRYDLTRTIIFDGNAREACKKFPKNVNVSATLALAGIGFDRTRVRIISDPTVTHNKHIINVTSSLCKLNVSIESKPFSNNPKTSWIAALSILRIINEQKEAIHIT